MKVKKMVPFIFIFFFIFAACSESPKDGGPNLAKAAKGKDEEGYRAEFIRLVEMSELLARH